MSRRRRGRAGGPSIPTVLATCLLLLPIAFASPQQKQQVLRNSRPEDGRAPSEGSEHAELEASLFSKLNKDHPAIDTDRSGAVATLAPASNAVRAPPAQDSTGRSGGLPSLQHARSLQDWEVEDLILLATVDGSLYAMNRTTGAEKWNLIMDKPMVESVYHRENGSSTHPMRLEDDSLWIVEPSKEGDLYRYSYQAGHNGGLQRMGFTVKKLSEHLSPYAAEDVVFTADKKTTLYTVDAATGTITKEFKPGGGSVLKNDAESCRRVIGLEGGDEDECGTSGSMILGRTEYTVGIQERDTAEPICTLIYSEWGPNNRDADLHSQYRMTMDNKYVYSRHDGNIFRFDHAKSADNPQELYRRRLPSPVVRVFDLAKPTDMDGESVGRDTQLIVLPQPTAPIRADKLWGSEDDRNRIFVNQTQGGGWFALSENTYPLVTGGALKALCYHEDFPGFSFSLEGMSAHEKQKALVGVHSLSEPPALNHRFPSISGPPPDNSQARALPGKTEASPMTSNFVLKNSKIIQTARDLHTADAIILAFVVGFITLIMSAPKWKDFFRRTLKSVQVAPPITQQLTSPPTSPMAHKAPELPILTAPAPEEAFLAAQRQEEERTRTPTPDDSSPTDGSPKTPTGSDGDEKPHIRIVEPTGADFGDDGNETPTPKKKARRGVRGGTRHKKKRNGTQLRQVEDSESSQPDAVQEAVEDALHIAEESKELQPNVEIAPGSAHTSAVDVSGPTVQIGHLRVNTDVILGYGSQGTVVYKGTFGGRDVAVKRMLQEFYDIASHEVGLLQESDDHPNVIRYYDKESAGEFLYIALELCPASLQEVVEKSMAYPDLIGTGLDPPDVLKQITAGLRYLHSLKIIHRDIKPQNILLSTPKRLPTAPNAFQPPRLLISDFGLCKKLEGDQSSFRATTAHAAGTSGWRAPELLVDDDAAPNPNMSNSQSSARSSSIMTSHSASEPQVLDTQSNRRATRAIDIFSLGCVFYYVLTGGSHPFDRDGKYMREANIVKGHYSLAELDRLGDYQWEAKDVVARMLSLKPRERPDAGGVLAHPFFWSAATRLEFLCNVSDAFEFEPRDPPSPALQALEDVAEHVLGPAHGDFLRVLPQSFKDTLGKQRKYTGGRMLDLLRAMRNKKNHYEDMPENVKKMVGRLPDGYLGFWTRRFPSLLMACHEVIVDVGWESRDRFKDLYTV